MPILEDFALGQTVRMKDGRTGVVRFIGQTQFAPGDWVGIELDEATGKNDGTLNDIFYFDCQPAHGIFSKPENATIIAQPAAKPAVAKKAAGRPSSMFTGGTARANGGNDPGLSKRMSLNAPSPSPVPRVSRPSSIARSPSKSPTKQLLTAPPSAISSRTATPSARVPSATLKPTRASMGVSRPSMGPPPPPSTRTTRPPSASSTTSKTAAPPARPLSGRVSLAPSRVVSRPEALRNMSSGSIPGRENGTASRGSTAKVASPRSDDEIIAPQPQSPVQARTAALERLTNDAPAPTTRPPPSRTTTASTTATASTRPAGGNTAAAREIQDLKTKLRIMEGKVAENREKAAQMNKIQADRDKFESIIQKLQTKLQPLTQEVNETRKENAELKAQLQEAEKRFTSIEEMQADHDSALELATLDREVAEETAEVLKHEFESLKEKYEEVEAELDLLREENQELSHGMRPEEKASAGWLNQERQNERLKEALFALRDITQQQEQEFKEQIKSLEEDLAGYETLQEEHIATAGKLAQAEATVEDLRQQLDTALGAEDMIEDLTERNMSQSEEIEELKAVIEDLENLKEINDELEINHVQNEKEMQEELDFKDSVITEQARRYAQQEETLEDMEYTVSRFRELVSSLQTDLEDMRASHAVTETESEQLSSKSRAMMDLNMKLQISAAKSQVKAIDLELRRLEAQEHEQHLEIVKLFLPDTYKMDRDSVLALLRFKRLAFKANLLNGFIKERINGQPHPGHEDDVFAGSEAADKLTWVQTMCDRFVNSISHCSLEHFARYEGALYELEPVERALNGWIDGLRRDDLKEKQCATELQRTMALMSHLGEVHIANDLEGYANDIHMRATLMQSHLESAAVAFTTIRNMAERVVPVGEDDELAQYFSRKAETVISQTRSTKVMAGKTVRALEDLKNRSLSLTPETSEAFEQAEAVSREAVDLARKIGLDLHQLLHEEGRTEPYTYSEIQTCAQRTTTTVAGVSESDLFNGYLSKLRILTSQISDLSALAADLTQAQEFERSPAPWLLRSQEIQALKTVPVDAEEDLRHLKEEFNEAQRTINMHKENLSIAHLKIETLESRMRDANAKASRITELEAQIERTRQQIASLKEDIEKQDRELKTLEADRDKWKTVASDSSRLMAGTNEKAGSKAGQERAVATAREVEALKSEITSLQASVRYLRDDSWRARVTEQSGYDWLSEPLVAKKPSPTEARRALVVSEGRDALGELVKLVSSAKIYDLGSLPEDKLAWRPARTSPGYHATRQAEEYAAWKDWQGNILRKSKALSGSGVAGQVDKRGDVGREARRAVARLQIRLPGSDGKVIPGIRRGGVEILGSREWEGRLGGFAV